MARLTISSTSDGKKINQDDKIRFKIKTDLDGEVLSPFIDIDFPKFPPLMGSSLGSFTYTDTNYITANNDTSVPWYKINSYTSSSYIFNNVPYYRLTLKIDVGNTRASSITKANDTLRIQAIGASQLIKLNTKSYPVIGVTDSASTIQISNVPTASVSASSATSVTTASARDSETKDYGKWFSIKCENIDILKSMMWNDYVRDILIFTYSYVTTGNILATTPKYLLLSNNNAPPTSALTSVPSYDSVKDFFGKKRKINVQVSTQNLKYNQIQFNIAVARYKKDSSGTWIGEWLQIKNGNPIWATATRSGGV